MPKRKVTVDDEEFEVDLELTDSGWEVSIGGEVFSIEFKDSKRESIRKRKSPKRTRNDGSGAIISAIPGKVVSIAVSKGMRVSSGEVVLILEAMKMQNEIKSPIDGIVKEINCIPGERVEGNVTLIQIDSDFGGDTDAEV
ncbi:MAG: hypothetical protein CMA12_06890 [Euryarchaeota archaeon]|nr:hypothetical protein [Euryarchaeota archaeon]|tara:strand:- start:294 stop:713 length:420 start_codon:yes stop_codon:yes gene_type:complete